jgi:23S rRNA pseudouridine1911/1915/1917 synthase
MAVRKNGKEAVTEYTVRQNFKNHSLIDIKLLTGRTHQIRVHLSAIGHPIYADSLYGKSEKDLGRQFLHAASLTFKHPRSGQLLSFTSPLPSDLQSILKKTDL